MLKREETLAIVAIGLLGFLGKRAPQLTAVLIVGVFVVAQQLTRSDDSKTEHTADVGTTADDEPVAARAATPVVDDAPSDASGQAQRDELNARLEVNMQRGRVVHQPTTTAMNRRLTHAAMDFERSGRKDKHLVIVEEDVTMDSPA